MLHLWEKGQRKTNKDMDEDKTLQQKPRTCEQPWIL